MSLSLPQLTLALFEGDQPGLDDFVAGPNGAVLAALTAWSAGEGPWFVLVTGAPGSGRTHLLQGAIRAAGRSAMYVPMRLALAHGAALLDDLDAIALLAIDDADAAARDPVFERALFDLFNRVHAADGRLLVSAGGGPRECGFQLPDLASRLSSGTARRAPGSR